MSKKLVIVLCALLLVSASNGFLRSSSLEAVQKTAQDVISTAISRVEEKLERTKGKIDKEVGIVFEATIDFGNMIWKKIEVATENAVVEVSKLAALAEGLNISECFEISARMVDVAKAVATNTSACFANEMESGQGYINKVYTNNVNKISEDVLNELKRIQEKAQHCGDNVVSLKTAVTAISCAQVAAADATWISNKFLIELPVKINEMNLLVKALKPSINNCVEWNGYFTADAESRTIVEKTKDCMERKIAEANTTAITNN